MAFFARNFETLHGGFQHKFRNRFVHKLFVLRQIQLQQRAATFQQIVEVQKGVALLFRSVFQRVHHCGANAKLTFHGDRHALRNFVRRQKAHAVHVVDKPIGVLRHDFFRIAFVDVVNFYGKVGGNSVTLQKHHLFLHYFQPCHGVGNIHCLFGRNALYLCKQSRVAFDNAESVVAEHVVDVCGGNFPHALDEPAGKVFYYSFLVGGVKHRVRFHRKLFAVLVVHGNFSANLQNRAYRERGKTADANDIVSVGCV